MSEAPRNSWLNEFKTTRVKEFKSEKATLVEYIDMSSSSVETLIIGVGNKWLKDGTVGKCAAFGARGP